MSKPSTYLLISLPTSIVSSDSHDEAYQALQAGVPKDYGSVAPFRIPEFKIGTLDALVSQADELSKLESSCEGVVAKVGETLKAILDGDEGKIAQQKTVNDKPVDQYLRSFSWNKVKYREDRPLNNMIEMLSKEAAGIDNDVKGKFNQYSQVKTNLQTLEKRQSGNLANKSLAAVVPPNLLVRDSEYIESHLIAVPAQLVKDFPKTYETLAPWVVPRSAVRIDADADFALYAVTTFKKHSAEFLHKCREQKWTPRDYSAKAGGQEAERKELDKVRREERQLWGEVLRLARIDWGEAVMAWVHVLALRVFVETVLRYGLPLSFVAGLVQTTPKYAKKVRTNLDQSYSYLAGNALGRDKRGRAIKDDSAEGMVPGQGGEGEYSAYVCYEFEIS